MQDEEFWSNPWRTKKIVQRELMQKYEEAFVAATPAKVGLDVHRDFPAAVIRVFPVGSRASSFLGSTIVTAVNLYTGALSAALAFDAPATPRPGPAANGGPPAMIGEGYILNLADRLKLPAIHGDYLVTFICLDKISQRSRMKVVETVGYEDPAVEEFFKNHLAGQLGAPKISPEPHSGSRWFPIYGERLDSPAIPSNSGINVSISRVNLMSADDCILTASYRLPVAPHQIVTQRTETAIIPVTLLLTGSVEPAPQLLRLNVPSYKPLLSEGDQKFAIGHFTLDLFQMVNLKNAAQTFFIYAFAGPVMAGPIPTAFITIPAAESRSAKG